MQVLHGFPIYPEASPRRCEAQLLGCCDDVIAGHVGVVLHLGGREIDSSQAKEPGGLR